MKILTTVVCVVLAVATVVYAEDAAETDKAASSEVAASTPEKVGRQFVEAMSRGDVERAKKLNISKEEFASIFASENLDEEFTKLTERQDKALAELKPKLEGAEFVRMNMQFTKAEPVTIPAGTKFGAFTATGDIKVIDNVHVVIKVDDQYKDLKLDELYKIGDNWRLLDAVTLTD